MGVARWALWVGGGDVRAVTAAVEPEPKDETALVKCVAAAMIDAAKVSEALSPLLSVAVTFRLKAVALVGTVPPNVSVDAVNLSQDGSAWPFDWVAA
jgi:hypothetical protein